MAEEGVRRGRGNLVGAQVGDQGSVAVTVHRPRVAVDVDRRCDAIQGDIDRRRPVPEMEAPAGSSNSGSAEMFPFCPVWSVQIPP